MNTAMQMPMSSMPMMNPMMGGMPMMNPMMGMMNPMMMGMPMNPMMMGMPMNPMMMGMGMMPMMNPMMGMGMGMGMMSPMMCKMSCQMDKDGMTCKVTPMDGNMQTMQERCAQMQRMMEMGMPCMMMCGNTMMMCSMSQQ